MIVEVRGRRFENVGGANAARRHSPSAILEEEGGLWPSAGKAELTRVASDAPSGLVLARRRSRSTIGPNSHS